MTPAGDFVQVAALPLTIGEDGVTRVLLLTSRETRRWVIPKGWPMKGRKPYEAAAQEALVAAAAYPVLANTGELLSTRLRTDL